jgi:hypothetical protein
MSLVFNWNPQRAVLAPPPVATPRRTQIRDGLALRDVDPAHRLITGEASNGGEDAMGDVIPPTALDLTRFRTNPVAPSDARPPTTRGGRPIRSPSVVQELRRRGYKTAIVAVAHRLCRVLYALLRNGTEFQP